MALTLGLDISHYQGAIDWAAVGRTEYKFALARLTIGRTTRDTRGRENLREMLGHVAVGGAYGVVGYSEPVEDGADLLVSEVRACGVDPSRVLVMLDAEDFNKRPDGTVPYPTINQIDRYAIRLHELIGRWPIAYVPGWFLTEHGYQVAGRALANCPWAQSHYIAEPWTATRLLAVKPSSLRGFSSLAWLQYTSSASVAGIVGNVDLNVFYGTLDELRSQLLGVGAPPPPPAPPEEDLSIVDAETKAYLDGHFDALAHSFSLHFVGDRRDGAADPHDSWSMEGHWRVLQQIRGSLDAVEGRLAALEQAHQPPEA